MIFEETKLKGAFIIKPEKKEDDRGFFARSFCQKEFRDHGLTADIVQCDISFNKRKGTFRGMHFQVAPFEEDKIVSCTLGALLDFIVDLRPASPTYMQSQRIELSQENGHLLYVPKSFAHGFFTLRDSTQVFYQMTQYYHPECARGFRYDDPAVNFQFPFEIASIAERDRKYPDLKAMMPKVYEFSSR
jgi:dTDP-4-dehydrorhamnose 3,5-epimerase